MASKMLPAGERVWEMTKRLFLLCILFGVALMLCACQHLSRGTTDPAPASNPTTAPVSCAPLTYLYFTEGNSYRKRVQGYEYRAEDGRHTAYFHMANEEELYPVPVDQVWVDTLNSFITRYGMMGWDGFSGSAPGLLDGTQFCVEFTLADGTSVNAGGYGNFPEGYGGASSDIDAHFLQLLPEDMRDW